MIVIWVCVCCSEFFKKKPDECYYCGAFDFYPVSQEDIFIDWRKHGQAHLPE